MRSPPTTPKNAFGNSPAGSGLLRNGDMGHRTAHQEFARTTGASPLGQLSCQFHCDRLLVVAGTRATHAGDRLGQAYRGWWCRRSSFTTDHTAVRPGSFPRPSAYIWTGAKSLPGRLTIGEVADWSRRHADARVAHRHCGSDRGLPYRCARNRGFGRAGGAEQGVAVGRIFDALASIDELAKSHSALRRQLSAGSRYASGHTGSDRPERPCELRCLCAEMNGPVAARVHSARRCAKARPGRALIATP